MKHFVFLIGPGFKVFKIIILDNALIMNTITCMCGRFAQPITIKELIKAFFIEDVIGNLSDIKRYNITPGQNVLAVIAPEQRRQLTELTWGLVPFWAKDKSIGSRMINARGESAPEKPSFKAAFKSRRCIIPASGFYEWKKEDKIKVPHYIHIKSQEIMALAGLYEHWKSGDEELHTCTILTTEANTVLSSIHNRMPVILPEEVHDQWLDPSSNIEDIKKFLMPYEADKLEVYPVSTLVNSPANDSPQCIVPAEQ